MAEEDPSNLAVDIIPCCVSSRRSSGLWVAWPDMAAAGQRREAGCGTEASSQDITCARDIAT